MRKLRTIDTTALTVGPATFGGSSGILRSQTSFETQWMSVPVKDQTRDCLQQVNISAVGETERRMEAGGEVKKRDEELESADSKSMMREK